MNTRYLTMLIVVLALLGGVYFAMEPQSHRGAERKTMLLFEGIDPGTIRQLKFEQGDQTSTLKLQDDNWTVLDRSGYQAADSKVRAFVMKLLSLEVSQEVSSDESGFDALGVSEAKIKGGKGRVTFEDGAGKVISGIFIGDSRKMERGQGFSFPSGQFVRRIDQKDVYLVGEPMTVTAGPADWLEKDLTNVLGSKVLEIMQVSTAPDSESVEFQLLRDESQEKNDPAPRFLLSTPLGNDEKLDDVALGQVRTGLENLRMDNVSKADAPELKEAKFNEKTIYKVGNGEIYTVSSAAQGGKYYLKLSVTFDEQLAKDIKDKADKEAKEKEAKEKEAQQSQSSSIAASSASSAPAKPIVDLSSADAAGKVNAKFEGWVYEVGEFVGKKFRHPKSELVVKKEAPKEPTQAAPPAKEAGKAAKTAKPVAESKASDRKEVTGKK